MSHRWTLYGLDKLIDIEQLDFPEFEDQLDDVVTCTYNDTIGRDGDEIFHDSMPSDGMFNLIKLEGTNWQVMIIVPDIKDKERGNVQYSIMSMNFHDETIQRKFLQIFKMMIGVVLWPLLFNVDSMINILDSVVDRAHWYDTVVYFENSRQRDNEDDERRLAQWSITISKYDCETLIGSSLDNNPYEIIIFPYIEKQTGFHLNQLPIKYISLRNYLRISENQIRTVRPSLSPSILISQLKYVSKLVKG
ncbi:similar to Saccharomyces cerevisiae YBR107C IML3 Protein with a role in kinetochore function [Maudiozyma saulgeensis]|uniref:Similar to Saccharomyces cerevisiae YBR107C IML3 Protein with a role in kinetochore function n=1 Tax=Maudiozyma saulgeensis TaxID=1789683 RepID=A0A1X7QXW2_9SACH|nr:similar to Saccharomyces cerevisiae YBR107C IML3 Protein with a role in kinetochore function [Kazachstania saulgeensis]